MASSEWLANRGERIAYRIGGLPIALAALFWRVPDCPARRLRRAYASYFWHPANLTDCLELAVALSLWPAVLLFSAVVLVCRNGQVIAQRHGRPVARQLADQLWLYLRAGILPPWYYIYALYDGRVRSNLAGFLTRCETKLGIYQMLHSGSAESLGDKFVFARHCERSNLPAIPVLAVLRGGVARGPACSAGRLPRQDLFVKPVRGRGGSGAERWDYVGADHYRRTDGLELDAAALLSRLRSRSLRTALLVQPRIRNHAQLADLSNGGALATVRALTCLDENGRPELIGAVLRMAVGANATVDNFHAGGIAADIDLDTGTLSEASDLGMFAGIGWVTHHPVNGALIAGRRLPQWPELRSVALRAHAAFDDRIMVGWDIAISEGGVVLVEGNGGPDVDIMQRARRRGLFEGRFGPLLAFHLEHRTRSAPAPAFSRAS